MDILRGIIANLQNRIEQLEKGLIIKKITIPTDGYFVVKKLTSDPGSPIEGEIWENTTSHHLKIYLNGTVTVIV